MAHKNPIDDSSTTVSANTPGRTIDLCNWAPLTRAGVPCRLKVWATNTTAGDTSTVILLDSTGATKIACTITGGAGSNLDTNGAWYVSDGLLPATLDKYDIQYGGNTTGTLYVKDWSLYPLFDVSPNEGTLSQTVSWFSLSATGTVV